MAWNGNYEGQKAVFRPCSGQPLVVCPRRAFHADSGGGYGQDCLTGNRYDVLAAEAPAWSKAVLAAAVAAGMPLRARQIGSAGKYHFWVLCASTPVEAEADRSAAANAEQEEAKRKASTQKAAEARGYVIDGPVGPFAVDILAEKDGEIIEASFERGYLGQYCGLSGCKRRS